MIPLDIKEKTMVLVYRLLCRLGIDFQSRCRSSEVIGVDCRAFKACSLTIRLASREGNGAAAQITRSSRCVVRQAEIDQYFQKIGMRRMSDNAHLSDTVGGSVIVASPG